MSTTLVVTSPVGVPPPFPFAIIRFPLCSLREKSEPGLIRSVFGRIASGDRLDSTLENIPRPRHTFHEMTISTLDRPLPSAAEMYAAIQARDTRYDGVFFTGVRTTGIFCRPGCPAKTPLARNVEFFGSAKEALAHGYRPCKRCKPLEARGEAPRYIKDLIVELERDPSRRIRDRDLRSEEHTSELQSQSNLV